MLDELLSCVLMLFRTELFNHLCLFFHFQRAAEEYLNLLCNTLPVFRKAMSGKPEKFSV